MQKTEKTEKTAAPRYYRVGFAVFDRRAFGAEEAGSSPVLVSPAGSINAATLDEIDRLVDHLNSNGGF